MKTISLNIFTNCTTSKSKMTVIERTYKSFIDTFEKIPVTVWCDPNPNKFQCNEYIAELRKVFPIVNKTQSLSDGYVKSIINSTTDYIFQLEWDWQFRSDLICHSLTEIMDCMSSVGIYHLRFNKRANVKDGWEKNVNLAQYSHTGPGYTIQYCTTNVLSNNPHIIDRKKYIGGLISRIKVKPGSLGIEEELSRKDLTGAIYGKINYPACVIHSDGRHAK